MLMGKIKRSTLQSGINSLIVVMVMVVMAFMVTTLVLRSTHYQLTILYLISSTKFMNSCMNTNILLMLIKTEVKRRAQTINQYILSVKDKVYQQRYKQAMVLLTHSKQSINNSYMAPYDPNIYLLDSLKAKNEKLRRERQTIERELATKQEEIYQIKIKRGYTYFKECSDFHAKLTAGEIGVFFSRLAVKMQDAEKVDYENATIQTDFCMLKIILDDAVFQIFLTEVLSLDFEGVHILLSWKIGEPGDSNYMVLRFWTDEERTFWSRSLYLSKLICESRIKQKLFFKDNLNNPFLATKATSISKSREDKDKDNLLRDIFDKNPKIGSSRSPADRMRRKSQFYPNMSPFGSSSSGLINKSKQRKVSEDFTITIKDATNRGYEQKYDKNQNNRSLEDDIALWNSHQFKKQESRKDLAKIQQSTNKNQKNKQEKQVDSKLNNSQTNNNRQIYFNEGSIHWIEEENEEVASMSSQSKNAFTKKNFLDSLSNPNQGENPGEGQAALMSFSIRKRNGYKGGDMRIREVQMGSEQEKIDEKVNPNIEESETKKINEIESINEQSAAEQSEKDQTVGKSNLDLSDKSEDLASENDNFETESTKYQLDDLISGIFLLKCAADGWNPKLKKLFLSNNHSQVCWKNQKGDDLKKIEITDIESISYGSSVITAGIKKHIKAVERRRCMVITSIKNKKTKLLEFYLPDGHSIESLQAFYEKLSKYVRYKNSESPNP